MSKIVTNGLIINYKLFCYENNNSLFLLFVALVATTGCDKDDNYYPAPEFEGDPTAEYIEANVDFDTQISQENSDPDTFTPIFVCAMPVTTKFTSLLRFARQKR